MACDPNRDLLPVKDVEERSNRGIICRTDYSILCKLKRSDLEDRYMRLYEENTQIKKQLNSQEEKLKRLGAKLIRVMGEKKTCTNNCGRRQDNKVLDELQIRIIELEHENYRLKDRNVVLKQQLANHARQHVAAHRSPSRSIHTSPRISHRQLSVPNVNENHSEAQLREAEEHITGLNNEIKSLHNKIDILQQDLEKSCLENQKTKVSENIELIRLQRCLKQQSIQITALQAQVKSSEKAQKLLRSELASAHKENEEALQVIAEKQKEILELYKKLEENNVSRLEQDELKERIHDLIAERDALRERGEFLMKTIGVKSNEDEIINDLKNALSAERSKKEELKRSLENTQKVLQSLKDSSKLLQSSVPIEGSQGHANDEDMTNLQKRCVSAGTQTSYDLPGISLTCRAQGSELELLASTQLKSDDRKSLKDSEDSPRREENSKRSNMTSVGTMTIAKTCEECCRGSGSSNKNVSNLTCPENSSPKQEESEKPDTWKICEAEKLNLQRELEYVKQLLRSQSQRCEAQEEEISRLKSELRVSEEKYNDALKRLDLHLKIFRHLESRKSRVADAEPDENHEEPGTSPEKKIISNAHDSGSNRSRPKSSPVDVKNETWKMRFLHKKFSSSSDDDDYQGFEKDKRLLQDLFKKSSPEKALLGKAGPSSAKELSESRGKNLESSSSDMDSFRLNSEEQDEVPPVPKPRTELLKKGGQTIENSTSKAENTGQRKVKPGGNISICIEWLKLEPGTSVWDNENIKLLYIDFIFLDVKGEETETPVSLEKPKKPTEKCNFNFTKSIEVTDYRIKLMDSFKNNPDHEILVFKVISEPEDTNDDSDCVDIGVATVTVKQFLNGNSNSSLFVQVKNLSDIKEIIGILSIKLDVSAIL